VVNGKGKGDRRWEGRKKVMSRGGDGGKWKREGEKWGWQVCL